MNVKKLRIIMDDALREEGLKKRRLFPTGPTVWSLGAGGVIPYFWPHAIRRSWGYHYGGVIGIEIPSFREWLQEFKPGDAAGIFRSSFVSYHIANEDVLGDFSVENDKPVPHDLWSGLLCDRLKTVPSTLVSLIATYRGNREALGWLAQPDQRHAWDFLLKWHEKPDSAIEVPKMLPDGRIIYGDLPPTSSHSRSRVRTMKAASRLPPQ